MGPPGSPVQVSSQPTPPVTPLHTARQARLISSDGRQFAVAIGSTVIGRGEGAQVRLADVGISRQHARLDYDGTRMVLTDLGSTNGTTVNGNRITAAALQHGDVIQLGTTTLTFRLDG
jgi:pSer/pThr/pTyr-binding forkhead associated (FHA) protein